MNLETLKNQEEFKIKGNSNKFKIILENNEYCLLVFTKKRNLEYLGEVLETPQYLVIRNKLGSIDFTSSILKTDIC